MKQIQENSLFRIGNKKLRVIKILKENERGVIAQCWWGNNKEGYTVENVKITYNGRIKFGLSPWDKACPSCGRNRK